MAIETKDDVLRLLRRGVDAETYEEIRNLWKAHSIAEDRRSIEGLLATLTEDCVYEVVNLGARWEGHEGAARFYTEFLGAFPDVVFELKNIVIGPQGVCEEAVATGTHAEDWLHFPATGERVSFGVVIFFPWDPETRLFKGERVYFFGP